MNENPLTMSSRFASYLRSNASLSDEEIEIAVYGGQVVIWSLMGILIITLISWPLNAILETLTIAAAIASLRFFTGGAHNQYAWHCMIMTALTVPLLGFGSRLMYPLVIPWLTWIVVISYLLAGLAVYFWAPLECPQKPIRTPERRLFLRRRAFLSILISGFPLLILSFLAPSWGWLVLAAAIGILWQALDLTPPLQHLNMLLDRWLTLRSKTP